MMLAAAAAAISSRSLQPAIGAVPISKGALATPQPRKSATADGKADKKDDKGKGEDVSGNCDEAEHVDDPECSGGTSSSDPDDVGSPGDDDNSGPGSGDDGDDDNSGPGGGDGDDGDDNSGSGSDDSDDDEPEDD
jgi:hypothetical protein